MKTVLTCADIAPVLGMDKDAIRHQAQLDASKLGFPVIVCGREVRIPAIPFYKFIGKEIEYGKNSDNSFGMLNTEK